MTSELAGQHTATGRHDAEDARNAHGRCCTHRPANTGHPARRARKRNDMMQVVKPMSDDDVTMQ